MSAPSWLLLLPFVAQAAALAVDERVYHRARGLPRWERVGHPLDSLTVAACYAWLAAASGSRRHALAYAALVAFSCLFVTKDEPLHARVCGPGERWTHALLYVLHPTTLLFAGYFWWSGRLRVVILGELALTAAVATYQLLYWNLPWKRRPRAAA